MKRYRELKNFIFLLVLPTAISFSIGGLRLTPCRLILLFNFLPSFRTVFSGANYGKDKADTSMMLFALWAVTSFWVNHDMGVAIESGGILILETITPYLIARWLLVDKIEIKMLADFLIKTIVAMTFLLVFESVTSINIFGKLIYPLFGVPFNDAINPRFGLTRARGSFDHPIISGIFCSSMIGMAWFTTQKKFKNTFIVILSTCTSLSSGAIASVMTQGMIIVWNKISKNTNNRWRILLILIVASYLAIEMLSNRSGVKVIITYLTFSPATAYWRTIIWDFGIINALDNPFFGIGFHDWVRPKWMHSGSMDNFFLVIMVRHGFPAFAFLAFSILSITLRLLYLKIDNEELMLIRRGWLTGLVGLCTSACTVHYWNQAYIYFMFYLGFGAAILKYSEKNYGK